MVSILAQLTRCATLANRDILAIHCDIDMQIFATKICIIAQ